MIIHDYFSSLFSVLRQRRYFCWNIERHLKHRYHYAKLVDITRINFSISQFSPYCTLLFSRKRNFKFLEVALSAALCSALNVWGKQDWNTANTTLDIYLLFKNGHKGTQRRCKVCSSLTKCTTIIDFRLPSVFFINLEHFSHPTVVLLFILWKGKCWLKVRREIFVKIIHWC